MKIPSPKIGTFIVLMGIALLISLTVGLMYIVHEVLKEGTPIVETTTDYRSPDMRWIATQEIIDNGLGFGQGMLYDEVHVRRPNHRILEHGDKAESVVFYTDASGTGGKPPRLKWNDPTHLVITYDAPIAGTGPGKRISNFHGISIEYEVVPGS